MGKNRGDAMSNLERPFDEELKELKAKLLEMAARAEEQIALAVRALKDREEKLACLVLDREEAVNLNDIEVDDMCLRLLALRQPMAADLRFITAAMKIWSGSATSRSTSPSGRWTSSRAPSSSRSSTSPGWPRWPRPWSGTP